MFRSQLFVLVFALFFWDGQALECAYKKESEEFCRRVNESYQLNNSSQHLLAGDLFKEDRQRLSVANQKIVIVLKKKSKPELIPALRDVFVSETNAVFQVRVSCGGRENGTLPCELGIASICLAMEELVNATMLVASNDQKTKILQAYKSYQPSENRLKWAQEAYNLGKKVMDILGGLVSN